LADSLAKFQRIFHKDLAGNRNHHEIAHRAGKDEYRPLMNRVNQWYLEQFVYLIERLEATPDVGGKTLFDGAAALLLASEASVEKNDWTPRARIVATANMGDCPTLMLNAPVPAAKKVLEKAGLTVDDIDLFEINEAFAVVAEKFIRDLDLDRDKVNVNGGAMALGHPIGATGSILIGTIVDELERQGKKRGLVTMCAAGGMAPAIIIERT